MRRPTVLGQNEGVTTGIKYTASMRKSILALVWAAFALSACQTMKSETLHYTSTDLPGGGSWVYNLTPSVFPVTLSGKLWLPEGAGPFPVVIWVHGTTLNSNDYARWRRDLRNGLINKGIGIYFNDSYTGRGLPRKSTAKKLNAYSRYMDGIRALGALAKHPKIDPKRIGISGSSFGANVAMRLQWETYMAQMQPDGIRYAAHVSIYPPCSAIIKDFQSTGAPLLILTGEKDYNDANRCRDRVAERRKVGAQIDLIIYPGAHHCFISSALPRMIDTPVYTDCGVEFIDKESGFFATMNAKRPWPDCIRPQGMCGGDRSAAADALKRTVAFFAEHLCK